MTADMGDVPAGLVLCCQICRWRPPGDIEMNLVEAHFDLEPDHDPANIRLELVAVCCDLEMRLDRTERRRSGSLRHHYTCGKCRRSKTINQEER